MDLLNIQECAAASRPSLISSLWSLQVHLQNETNSMSLDMPLISGGAGCAGSQQSLPGILMSNGEKNYNNGDMSCNSNGQANEMFGTSTSTNYYTNTLQQFRSVKSLSDLKSLVIFPNDLIDNNEIHSPTAPNVSPFCQRDNINNDAELLPSTSSYGAVPFNNTMTISFCEVHRKLSDKNDPGAHAELPSSMYLHNDYNQDSEQTTTGNIGAYGRIGGGGLSRQQRNNNICQWLQKLTLNGNDGSESYNGSYNDARFSGFTTAAMEIEMPPQ